MSKADRVLRRVSEVSKEFKTLGSSDPMLASVIITYDEEGIEEVFESYTAADIAKIKDVKLRTNLLDGMKAMTSAKKLLRRYTAML